MVTEEGRRSLDDLTDSFLALIDETFRRLLDEPDAHLHVTGVHGGGRGVRADQERRQVRRRAEVYGSENWTAAHPTGSDQGPWTTPRGRRIL